jgi:hypothetical protein
VKELPIGRAELVTVDGDEQRKLLESIGILLARLTGRDLSKRPRYVIEPDKGVEWTARVYFEEIHPTALIAEARGKGPDDACRMLLRAVANKLRDRVVGDVAAFETALGERFDFGLVGKPNPHVDEPPINAEGRVVDGQPLARR